MTTQPILLDTCALVFILKGAPVGLEIINTHKLDERKDKPLVSAVSAGEMLALISNWKWGEKKVQAAKDLLRKFVLVPVTTGPIKDAYGDLMGFSKDKGLSQGQNDHWIAATAQVTGAILVTSDKDFDGLHRHGKVIRAFHDPEPKLPPAATPAKAKVVRTKKAPKK
jgi:predicted nucleic acid-binding protein